MELIIAEFTPDTDREGGPVNLHEVIRVIKHAA